MPKHRASAGGPAERRRTAVHQARRWPRVFQPLVPGPHRPGLFVGSAARVTPRAASEVRDTDRSGITHRVALPNGLRRRTTMAAPRGFPNSPLIRIANLAASLVLLALLNLSAAAQVSERYMWPGQGDGKLDSTAIQSIAASSSVEVQLQWTQKSPAPFKSKLRSRVAQTTTESTLNLGSDGVERWVRALDLESSATRTRAQCARDTTNPSCQVRLTFKGVSGSTGVVLDPRESDVSITSGTKWQGSISLFDRTEPVRQLLAELFPTSTSLGAVNWCTKPANDTTRVVAVYVEQLPEIVSRDPPTYPFDARQAGVSGTVI